MSNVKAFTDLNDVWVSYALNITKDSELSKDLVQEFYIKILDMKCLDKIVTNGKPNRSFVYTVIRNMFLDIKRKETESIDISNLQIIDIHTDLADRFELENKIDDVLDVIKQLNSKEDSSYHCKYLMAYTFSDKSLRGLAEEIGTTNSIVINAVNNGKRKIREEYLRTLKNNRAKQ